MILQIVKFKSHKLKFNDAVYIVYNKFIFLNLSWFSTAFLSFLTIWRHPKCNLQVKFRNCGNTRYFHGTQGFRGTPVENNCIKQWLIFFTTKMISTILSSSYLFRTQRCPVSRSSTTAKSSPTPSPWTWTLSARTGSTSNDCWGLW
jgi:hypothetical protein